VRALLGVYVTGAIAPADRPVVLRHLASCERCRDELAGLAGLPGLLRRPSVQAAAEGAAPEAAARGAAARGAAARGADRLARVRRLLGGMALRWRRHRWVLPPPG
jgi:predicted anti-sigma-YlaC factor YlaD